MFINFYDYIIQILEWCQLNCLNLKNHSINFKNTIKNDTIKNDTIKNDAIKNDAIKNDAIKKILSENDFFNDWVDYGFGENDVIH